MRLIVRAALTAAALGLAIPSYAAAAPPPNDDFANAQELTGALPIAAAGTSIEATRETGEPAHGFTSGSSVWYSWTPASAERVAIETCESDYNTILAVYTGDALSGLSKVGASGDAFDCGAGNHGSRVKLSLRAGTTYRIAVDGFFAATGTFTLAIRHLDSPANDDFADAQALSGALPIAVAGTNVDATREAGEPRHMNSPGGASVWYSWTAPSADPVAIESCAGRSFFVLIGVYTGDAVGSVNAVRTSSESCGDFNDGHRVWFSPTAGTTYRIAVDGLTKELGTEPPIESEGPFPLKIGRLTPPANDDFANAQVLPGALPVSVTGGNRYAGKQPGEPNHAGKIGGASVWYSWTPETSGPVFSATCDSGFDTLLAVYTGDSVGSLTPVAGNDDGCTGTRSKVVFTATAGTTYRIAVDGFNGAFGSIALQIRTQPPPANDNFADAATLSSSLPASASGNNVAATKEAGEPDHNGNPGGASIWWRWTPQQSSPVVIECSPLGGGALLGVYTGDAVDALTRVTSSDCTPVKFMAGAGITYRIAMDGRDGRTGALSVRLRSVPLNDDFADAQVLSGELPISASGSTRDATEESGEPDHAGFVGGASIWYRWTPEHSGLVAIETCDSDFDTTVGVYTGDAVDALTEVAGDDDACGDAAGSRVVLSAAAGTIYRIAVDGSGTFVPARGTVELRIRAASRPANDDFADAQPISGLLPLNVSGSNRDATSEPGEPKHASNSGGASVWYSWTPATEEHVVLDTCASDYDTLLAVYVGDAVDDLDLIVKNDQGCSYTGGSWQRFTAKAGATYMIAIDGWQRQTGSIELSIRARPHNDEFAAAQVIGGALPINTEGTIEDATGEPDEPGSTPGDPRVGIVWYSWTPRTSAPVAVETCRSETPVNVAVYTGDELDSLTSVVRGGSSYGCFGGPHAGASVVVAPKLGTTYRIAVESDVSTSGRIVLTIRRADVPANDDFARARALSGSLPVSVRGTEVDASGELEEPGSPVASVWYSWRPERSGPVVAELCSVDYQRFAVYTGGSLEALVPVPTSQAGCGRGVGYGFDAQAGETYRLAVDSGFAPQPFTLTLRSTGRPVNDDFASATVLTGPLPLAASATNRDATREDLEPGFYTTSVWFRWTPTESGPVAVETCGSDFDTILGAYAGDAVHDLTELAVNNDTAGCGSAENQFGEAAGSRVVFNAAAGTTYSLSVAGVFGAQGSIALKMRRASPPANDDFENARELTGALPVSVTGSNLDASAQADEPRDLGRGGGAASIWYRWTPAATGLVAVETCASAFDTVLGVYGGDDLAGLSRINDNEHACGEGHNRSSLRFVATAGTTYSFIVAGQRGDTGSLALTIREARPPDNDDFADARVLPAAPPLAITGSNVDATTEPEESGSVGGYYQSASVWYRWTPDFSGPVVLDPCGTDFSINVAVYTGTLLYTLAEVASGPGISPCEKGSDHVISFIARAGRTYSILVDGFDGKLGSFALPIHRRPANDNIGSAQALGDGSTVDVHGINVAASKEHGEPDHAGDRGGASVWYRWTPRASGTFEVKTCDSDFSTGLGVYTGTAVNRLTPATTRDADGCGRGSRGKLRFAAVAGTTYLIAVDGREGATGAISLSIRRR